MSIRKKIQAFKSNIRASTAIMFAVSAPALIGFAALAVDMGVVYSTEADLQSATDEVALAALTRIRDTRKSYKIGFTEAQLTQEMVAFANYNVPANAGRRAIEAGDIEFGVWDFNTRTFTPYSSHSEGWTATNAVRVNGHMTAARDNAQPTYFGAMFRDSFDIRASSIAVLPVPPGFHALAENASPAVYMTNADLDISDFVINSTADAALTTYNPGGSGSNRGMGGKSIQIAGNANAIGAPILGSDKISANQHGVRDFMEHHPQPTAKGCDYNRYVPRPRHNKIVLKPGTYCNGVYMTQNVDRIVFEPGQYIIKDGPLWIQNSGTVVAEGVNVFLTGYLASMTLQNVGAAFFRAPSTGEQRGVTIMSTRGRKPPVQLRIRNVGNFTSMGQIYLPRTNLNVSNTQFDGNCVMSCVIASKMGFSSVLANFYGGISTIPGGAGNANDLTGVVHPVGLDTSFRPYLITE